MKNLLFKLRAFLIIILCLAMSLLFVACNPDDGGNDDGGSGDGTGIETGAGSGSGTGTGSGSGTGTGSGSGGSSGGETGPDFIGNVTVGFDEGFVGSWAYIGDLASSDAQVVFTYDEDSDFFSIDKRLRVSADGKFALDETDYYGTRTYAGQGQPYSTNCYKVTMSDGENEYLNKTLFIVSQKDGYLYASNATYEGEYNESSAYVVFAKISNDVSTAKNADGSEKASSFLYNVVNNEIEIVKYVGINTEIKIPSQIDGKNVTRLGKSAMVTTNAQSVVFPSTLKSIGDNAFSHAQNLKNISFEQNSQLATVGEKAFQYSALQQVTIPASTTYIGQWAFADCDLTEVVFEQNSNLETLDAYAFFRCGPIESIALPKSLKTIGASAFAWIDYLTQVTFEQGSQLETIGDNAFSSCGGISEFVIPSGVTKIGGMAFYGCGIQSIVIPASVQEIGYKVFDGSSLQTVVYCEAGSKPEGWPEYWYDYTAAHYWGAEIVTDSQGLVFAIQGDEATVSEFDDSTANVTVPATINGKTVVAIGNYAFWRKTNFEAITLPASIERIGCMAFYDSNLKTIDIPANVKEIGYGAFEYCYELESINVPQNSQLTTIGEWVFSICPKLTSLYIPASVSTIGANAFFGSGFVKVYCQNETKPAGWDSDWDRTSYQFLPVYWDVRQVIEQDGFIYAIHTDEVTFVGYINTENKNVTLPESINEMPVTTIGISAFSSYPGLESVTLPSTIKTIDSSAFKFCQNLTSVNLPQGLQTIGREAFYECQKLTGVVFPSSLKSIGQMAYYGCDAIGKVIIPKTVEQLEAQVFWNCYRISIYCEPTELPAGWHNAWSTYIECIWYSENKPTTKGTYWHYVDGVPTVWEAV